ncbi:MAG TPA: Hsp33 family molecular chaperone HslO [Spirochaetia bacterium]|nr:Hsp33 family molecular chaperone HslO [Spirochaetia bacterium]
MHLRKIENPTLVERLDNVMNDGVDIFLLSRGRFRAAILHGTRMVNQMRMNHELGVLETLILGHAYMGSALMATSLKGIDRIGIHLQCDGPVGGVHVESTAHGQVRGYLNNSRTRIDKPVDSFNTAPFIGEGTLTVMRYIENNSRPFSGRIELESGNIAQDLTRYYAISEQTPTSISLSIQFDPEGLVIGAGGLLVQALPESTVVADTDNDAGSPTETLRSYESTVIEMEQTVRGIPSLGTLFSEGRATTQIIRENFARFDPDVIGTRPLEFACNCSGDRFRRFLGALPNDELADIKANGPFPLHITCHNCNSVYAFSQKELQDLGENRQPVRDNG